MPTARALGGSHGSGSTSQCLGGVRDEDGGHAQELASLPAGLGGLSLRSAEWAAPAAYWATWADAFARSASRARRNVCCAPGTWRRLRHLLA